MPTKLKRAPRIRVGLSVDEKLYSLIVQKAQKTGKPIGRVFDDAMRKETVGAA